MTQLKRQQEFYRDTWVEIDLDALYYNMKEIRNFLPSETRIFATVKANGYGHGDIQTAKTVLKAGAHGLTVAFLDEALALREEGINVPILILGATRSQDVPIAADHQISLTVYDGEWLKEAEKHISPGKKVALHIKCDTGMGRIGVRDEEELKQIEDYINNSNCFSFEGIFTHFATADELDTEYYERQLSRFKQLLQVLKTTPTYVHAANSAAALYHSDATFNATRIGIAMYGLTPSAEIEPYLPFKRREVFSLHSKIIHVKKMQPGEKVGYGADYTTENEEWIATIPIGYADGWIRKLRGFHVLAGGERVPIVGKICMDQSMIKLPYYMPIGTQVTLIGEQNGQFISVDEVANKLDTINYEVTCTITNRVPRVFKSKSMRDF